MKNKQSLIGIIILTILLAVTGVIALDFTDAIFKKEQITEKKYNPDKPWFRSSYSGISITTPEELELEEPNIPAEYADLVDDFKAYSYYSDVISIMLFYYDFKSEIYNAENGLYYSINNSVNVMNGESLQLDIKKLTDAGNAVFAEGTFFIEDTKYLVKGYCYYNYKDEVALIGCYGKHTQMNEIAQERVINSIDVKF